MGPPGVGKTTVVYALANDLNCSVIELNASDVRSQDAIKQKLGETVKSTNLLSYTLQKSTGKIILIDEVDGISGQSDRGGVGALEKIIETTQFPIIMTCNFRDDQKFGGLYKLASPILELDPAKNEDIISILKRITQAEHVNITDIQLQTIASHTNGDYRSAINDLQAIAQGGEDIDEDALENINMNRDTTTDVQEFMTKFFSTATIIEAKRVLDDVEQEDIDYNNIHKWLNENILNYITKIHDLRYAFDNLAFADHLLGYIHRTQDWSFLPYFFDILAGGIRFAKSDLNFIKSSVNSPRYFRLRGNAEDETALKLQTLFRVSLNEVLREISPLVKFYEESDPEIATYLAEKLNTNEKTRD
jgi:replication factor C large subunit